MDYQLVLLIAMIGAALFLSIRMNRRAWPGHPSYAYQQVFGAGGFGLLLLVSGLIGWDLSHSRGWFQGTKWVDGPIWWQVGLGAGLLLVAGFLARRITTRPTSRRL